MKKKIFPLIILASLFFMSGVVLQSKNPGQYVKLKHSVKSVVKKIQLQNLSKAASRSCNITQISTIPKNSHLVVGHLYKHPSVNNKNPLGKLPELIYKNRENMHIYIFIIKI